MRVAALLALMSRRQKMALYVGVAALLVSAVVVPWYSSSSIAKWKAPGFLGYDFIWRAPPGAKYTVLDTTRLLMEWGAIVLLTAVAVTAFRTKRNTSQPPA